METYYKRVLFRSKLEANWAEYFDFENIDWHYEPETFTLKNGTNYLPDFYLPKLQIFVEVKGTLSADLSKPAKFFEESGHPILIALPDGNFFYLDHIYSNQISREPGHTFMSVAVMNNNYEMMKRFQESISCFVSLESDNVDQKKYFSNSGLESPDYCGYPESDYWNSMKDHSDRNGRDIRANYFGGRSTWQQRGFAPSRWAATKK